MKSTILENQKVTLDETTSLKTTSPSGIMQIGMGFWSSKLLLTAVKFDVFSVLGNHLLTAGEIKKSIGIHERGVYDFLDSLVALKLLRKYEIGGEIKYQNTEETGLYLDQTSEFYLGGMLKLANDRLYKAWDNLEEALITGLPQNNGKAREGDQFYDFYTSEENKKQFIEAMNGFQKINFNALAEKFDFFPYSTLCDIGGSNGLLSIILANNYPEMNFKNFDLPSLKNIAEEKIKSEGVENRVEFVGGDFFADKFPHADVITMGNVLHNWDLEQKQILMRKAYDALPENGVLMVIENIIDNQRSANGFGLLMSLQMLMETNGGFDFTGMDFERWALAAGFRNVEIMPLVGASSLAVAYK